MAERRTAVRWILVGVLLISSGTLLVHSLVGSDGNTSTERPTRVEVKRVISGQYLKVSPDDRLVYAGIRTPHETESLFEEARVRNEELVLGRELRLRFDTESRDADGRLAAYAFVDDLFINDVLVREGLAYVRAAEGQQRFKERLLGAQREARDQNRGIWEYESDSIEGNYPADPKYGNFHLSTCDEVPKIKPARLQIFESKDQAFAEGFAPCSKCRP